MAPLTTAGDDYKAKLQWGVLRWGLGVRHRLGPLEIGAQLGPSLRWVRQARSGTDINAGTRWHIGAGLGGRAYGNWFFSQHWGLTFSTTFDRFFPYQQISVDGQKVLSTGRMTQAIFLGGLLRF
ncbi:MAG: hypothetical protein R3C68_18485 [Myxococcota bacterium]